MVPGSTLMYGSSLRMLTRRPRALRIRPMLAAVMPLPRLLATPPVTKTYFDMGQGSSGVFLMLSESAGGRESRAATSAGRLGWAWNLTYYELGLSAVHPPQIGASF